MLREVTATLGNIVVDSFHGLLVDYCRERDIPVVVKGLRAVSDFDYELQMAQMNHRLTGRGDVVRGDQPGVLASSPLVSSRRSRVRWGRHRPGARPGAGPARPPPGPPVLTAAPPSTARRNRRCGRPRQARRAHRHRRERALDADVGVLRRQPRRGARAARGDARAAARGVPPRRDAARGPRGGRRRGPPRGRAADRGRPSRSGPAGLRDRGRQRGARAGPRRCVPRPPRRPGGCAARSTTTSTPSWPTSRSCWTRRWPRSTAGRDKLRGRDRARGRSPSPTADRASAPARRRGRSCSAPAAAPPAWRRDLGTLGDGQVACWRVPPGAPARTARVTVMPEETRRKPTRLDPRSPLVIDTRELGRRPGSMRKLSRSVPAPADLGVGRARRP